MKSHVPLEVRSYDGRDLRDVAAERACGSCGEPAPYTIVLRGKQVPACLRHLNHWREPVQHGYGDTSDCLCGRNFNTVRGLREHITKARAAASTGEGQS